MAWPDEKYMLGEPRQGRVSYPVLDPVHEVAEDLLDAQDAQRQASTRPAIGAPSARPRAEPPTRPPSPKQARTED